MSVNLVGYIPRSSRRGRWLDDLVPRTHNIDDLTAANDASMSANLL